MGTNAIMVDCTDTSLCLMMRSYLSDGRLHIVKAAMSSHTELRSITDFTGCLTMF